MNPPQVYTCSPSWALLPPPSPNHPSGSSQCPSPKHPVSCIEPGLATRFIHDILHVSMPFSQIFPPSPSPTESINLFYTSVSLLLSRTQGYCYHLSKFHIYALVYCIGVFPSGLLHSVWQSLRLSTCMLSRFSHVQFFATYQAPLSLKFSRKPGSGPCFVTTYLHFLGKVTSSRLTLIIYNIDK